VTACLGGSHEIEILSIKRVVEARISSDCRNFYARALLILATLKQVNEFYKKGCQEKSSSSTGRREDFVLAIQPTLSVRACSGLSFLAGFIFWW
jgi:hypothetical protein